ncbi:MAG TPA: cellulase family glycosylhydrolase [Tepidisphaeraceae bacterium]|jgi:hypothetical protein|nr:cellulase family glycosylhydrolase [Tepidisphaeraceae bacterium]
MTRIWITLTAFVSLTIALHARGQGAKIPPLVVPQGAGVNIHFTDAQPGELEMLKAAGFKWIRMDFSWSAIEKQKGVYDFSAYDRLLASLDKAGIHAMLILDYANPNYDNDQSPSSDEGRAAFAKWAAAAVVHFKGRGVLWEMYNEPNGFWRPQPNIENYVKLALEVGKAVRAAAPEEMYIGPGLSGFDNAWFEACFKAGLLEYWSAVTVHPYRQSAPESAADDYRHLREMIDRYAPKDKVISVLSGEWGYSSVWAGMDPAAQGKMLARQWLTNISNDVPLSIWYDWHDDGPDPKEGEHHFGTVLTEYHKDRDPVYDPKPAYLAAKTYASYLDGFKFNKRLLIGSPAEDYVLIFDKGDEVRVVAWTTSASPHPITLPASAGAFTVTSHAGEKLPALTADAKGLAITLTDAPQYLAPDKPNDVLRIAAAWQRAPLEIRASAPAAVNIELSFANPTTVPVTVNNGSGAHPVPPGQPLKLNHAVNITRSPAPISAQIEWDFNGVKLAQQTQVVARNPIAAGVLPPTGDSLIVKVENRSTEPLDGKVLVTDETGKAIVPATEVKLAAGAETLVRFPLPKPPATTQAATTQSTTRVATHPSEKRYVLKVLDAKGAEMLSKPPVRFVPIAFEPASLTLTPEGDATVASEQSIAVAQPPDGPPAPGATSIQVNYSFAAGWKYLCLQPKTPELGKIDGKPSALGLWVHGDGTGNIARARLLDSTKQTFQPDGPPINWKDWKYIVFPLDGTHAGRWGGPADGVMHYPISLDTIFLIDSATRGKTSGTIFLSTPTLIYHD